MLNTFENKHVTIMIKLRNCFLGGRLGHLAGLRSRPAGWEAAQLVVPGQDPVAFWSRLHRAAPSADTVGGPDRARLATPPSWRAGCSRSGAVLT